MQKVLQVALIEDDADDREFLETALHGSRPGLRISSFKSGPLFMGELGKKNIRPDLIVTDLRMPHMTGFELISTLKGNADTRDIPVVVVSTSGSDEDVRKATNLGASAYFVKPYSVEGFEEISRKILMPFHHFSFSLVRLKEAMTKALNFRLTPATKLIS